MDKTDHKETMPQITEFLTSGIPSVLGAVIIMAQSYQDIGIWLTLMPLIGALSKKYGSPQPTQIVAGAMLVWSGLMLLLHGWQWFL